MSKRLRRLREKVHVMRRLQAIDIASALVMLFAADCNTNDSQSAGSGQARGDTGSGSLQDVSQGAEPVNLDPKDFATRIDNPYWPMEPGTRWTYRETEQEGAKLTVVVTVSDQTKKSAIGVTARVVRDTVTQDGKIIETPSTGARRTRRATSGISVRTPPNSRTPSSLRRQVPSRPGSTAPSQVSSCRLIPRTGCSTARSTTRVRLRTMARSSAPTRWSTCPSASSTTHS